VEGLASNSHSYSDHQAAKPYRYRLITLEAMPVLSPSSDDLQELSTYQILNRHLFPPSYAHHSCQHGSDNFALISVNCNSIGGTNRYCLSGPFYLCPSYETFAPGWSQEVYLELDTQNRRVRGHQTESRIAARTFAPAERDVYRASQTLIILKLRRYKERNRVLKRIGKSAHRAPPELGSGKANEWL